MKSSPPKYKVCTKCEKKLAIRFFTLDRGRADGHHSRCRKCMRESTRDHYRRNRRTYLANQKRRREENPRQRRAHHAVEYAVRKGRLVRPSRCPQCGATGCRIEAHHHNGYAEGHELDIVWLCTSCHRKEDR